MNERTLIILATALAAALIAGRLALLLVRRALPASAREGHTSLGEVWGHFRAAIDIVARRKWLPYAPMIMLVLSYVVYRAPHLAYIRSQTPQFLSIPKPPLTASDHAHRLLRIVLAAAPALLTGYAGAVAKSSPVGLLVLVVAFLWHGRRLREATDEANRTRLTVVTWAAWVALVCLAVLLVVNYVMFWNANIGVWLAAVGLAATVTSWFLLAVLEAGFLLYVRGLLVREPPASREVWNGALAVLYPLTFLNATWTAVRALPQGIRMAVVFLERGNETLRFLRWLWPGLTTWERHANPALALAFCCAPFVIVIERRRFASALAGTLAFVGVQLRRWAVVVGLCILLVAAPRLAGYVPASWCRPFGWWSLVLGLVIGLWEIPARVVATIALFHFYLRWRRSEEPGDEPAAS